MNAVYLAGSRVVPGQKISFQYVNGNDRPYIRDVAGTFVEKRHTVGNLEFIHVNIDNSVTHDLFWVHLMVDGSVNFSKEG
jgi:hypothetical protein